MQTIYKELTKEEYERIDKLSRNEQHAALFPDGVPLAWECGYGYYGHGLVIKDGKYFACFSIGDSCD